MNGGNCTKRCNSETILLKNSSRTDGHPYDLRHMIKVDVLFGYVYCHIKIPVHLRQHLAHFPCPFQKHKLCRIHFGPLRQKCVDRDGIMSQLRQLYIIIFQVTNGTIINPLLLF